MKFSHHILRFCILALAIWITHAQAQNTDASTPLPGTTVITSDELRSDQENHTAVFTGNVVAVGTNFNMKCQEMTVTFTKDGKIDNIIAKGEVVIEQPGRIAHCGQAQYFHEDDKFVLTDQPVIVDNKNQIEAPKITIYRTNQQMITDRRTKSTMRSDIGSATSSPAPGATTK